MGYQSGFINRRVIICSKVDGTAFGNKTRYTKTMAVWANISFVKGIKAMHEGALDAYDTVMIRMRWNGIVARDSLLLHDGKTYQILSFHRDYEDNQIQITAQEMLNQVDIIDNRILVTSEHHRIRTASGHILTAPHQGT